MSRINPNTVDLGVSGLGCQVVAFLSVRGGSVAGIMRGFPAPLAGLPAREIFAQGSASLHPGLRSGGASRLKALNEQLPGSK